jgi:peptidoglycan/LPS O-acetylase OafA/YrhL
MALTSSQPTAGTSAAGERRRGHVVTGLVAGVAAAAVVLGLALLAGAAGVDFELPDGEKSIPWAAFPQMVVIGTLIGLAIAAVARRRSARPARTFVRVTVALTALSLVPPFVTGANAATAWSLVLLHVVAAAIVIPAIARRLQP